MPSTKPRILEVIVDTLEDAIEAAAGGADRLEVVRDLDRDGLTPSFDLVREIQARVNVPLRVMLRENETMALKNAQELELLAQKAAELNRLEVDGIVAGFVSNGEIDVATLRAIASAAPKLKITFHRAFDALPDPLQAIETLKSIPQVDRILTIGGHGTWAARKLRLQSWQRHASPEITIMAGAGLLADVIADLRGDPEIREMHVGRAARIPQETGGRVSRLQVVRLKGQPA